ncbi:MAG TPA: hypothetical protein VGM27_03050, partial [Acidobacteriaceae bacterium]
MQNTQVSKARPGPPAIVRGWSAILKLAPFYNAAAVRAITNFLDHDSGARNSIKEAGVAQIDCGLRNVGLSCSQSSKKQQKR